MSRTSVVVVVTVLAAISLVLTIGLLATGGAAARAGASPPLVPRSISGSLKTTSVIAPEEPYCYAWDLSNTTGQDLDGLTLRLQGDHAVSAVYTDTLNPFFGLDAGYESGTNSYRLVFTDGVVYDSDLVHVGFCSDLPDARLSTAPDALEWTQGITVTQPPPLMAGVELNWVGADQLAVNLVNEQAITVTLENFVLLDADEALSLSDLIGDVAATLPLAGEAITEPVALAPNAVYTATFGSLLRGHDYVIDARLSAEDDPFNTVRVFAQTGLPPFRVYLPVLSK